MDCRWSLGQPIRVRVPAIRWEEWCTKGFIERHDFVFAGTVDLVVSNISEVWFEHRAAVWERSVTNQFSETFGGGDHSSDT
jgi:hypothetical protein